MGKVRFNRDPRQIAASFRAGVAQGIDTGTRERIIQRAIELSPIDTEELIDSYTTEGSLTGDIYKQVIGNTAPHFGLVELGTSRAKFYHKYDEVYRVTGEYKGLRGARMVRQAIDENKNLIRKSIRDNVRSKLRGL